MQCEEYIALEQSTWRSCICKEELMTTTRDELLKVHQKELLTKYTGIDNMFTRTDIDDAELAREGEFHLVFFVFLFVIFWSIVCLSFA